MAHREIDYSKMADKFETCYPSKNLRSFCYREKINTIGHFVLRQVALVV